MNCITSPLTRRTFLFSTAAVVASPFLHVTDEPLLTDEPLRVSIVGFGRHARRLLDSVTSSVLYVDSVFDPNPLALRSASTLLKQRQRFLPELVRACSPMVLARSSSPVLLCSPPHTWAALIAQLTSHGRPVLAYHTELFAPRYWPESLDLLSHQPANLLLVGIDPAFPLDVLNSFHSFARARGAINSSYSLWHPGWPHAQQLAFHFDCLNAAFPQDVSPEEHRQQWQFLPMPVDRDSQMQGSPFSTSASCTISASGPGIAFGARLEIAEDPSDMPSCPEHLVRFVNFCRVPQAARNRILWRQSALLKLVDASTQAMSIFG
jgi:hypothetical protein